MRTLPTIATLLILAATAVAARAAGPHGPVYVESTGIFSGDAAMAGYDPVAIFTAGQAIEGSSAYTLDWNGARWWFASAAHRELFERDPTRYAPQYGGHCAAAMASKDGRLAKGAATSWTLHDGKLYLNYDDRVMKNWRQHMATNIARADENWKRFIGQ